MVGILEKLLESLIPLLVLEAEKIFSRGDENHGEKKHAWVTAMITEDVVPMLEKRLPDFLKPDAAHLAQLIDDGIEKALAEAGL
jgi:hypothetical protein